MEQKKDPFKTDKPLYDYKTILKKYGGIYD